MNTNKFYINIGWIPVRQRLPDSLKYNHKLTLISKGAYGAVYDIVGTSCVMKVMNYTSEKIFVNEVSIGQIKGIESVGPRIYCYNAGEPGKLKYIMDNVAKMDNCKDCKAMTLNEYFEKGCLSTTHPFYNMMYKTLVDFYKITKGWHGDLHMGNIMVVLDQNNKLKSVKIIDYGAHQKFSNGNNVPDCLEDIFKKINRNFTTKNGTLEKIQSLNIYKKRGNAQPFKKNQNTLKHGFGKNSTLLQILSDINKQTKINKLDITTLNAGSDLYKGSKVPCKDFDETKIFFVTQDINVAKIYANPYICKFTNDKPLKLFNLNFANILKLTLSNNLGLSSFTKNKLALVTGAYITEKTQIEYLKEYGKFVPSLQPIIQTVINSATMKINHNNNNTRGSRLSIGNINKDAFGSLCEEFLDKNKFHGYYAPELPTRYHPGQKFHSEIMLCNADKILTKQGETIKTLAYGQYYPQPVNLIGTPMYGRKSTSEILTDGFIAWLLMKNLKFTKEMFKGATTFLTGGMALKLYLEDKKNFPKKIPKSNDFDISVSIDNLNIIGKNRNILNNYINNIETVILPVLNSFLQDLRSSTRYPMFKNAQIEKQTYIPQTFPRLQNATTERQVYQVLRYSIIGVDAKPIEFVDVALCYIPGIKEMVKESPKIPFPILKHVYMLRDIASVFTKSFISTNKLNTNRNPINGSKKEKGLKNYNRITTLCGSTTNTSKNKVCQNMLKLKGIINLNTNQTTKKQKAIQLIQNQKILQNIKNLKPSR